MHFVYWLALGVAALVAAPYVAHRLRRRRGEERVFAAARLVPPAPPRARRRSKLEDGALFGTRGLSVLALALLGASPLVRCSRLALQRSSGASVAIVLVVDDSMSMRAASGNKTRFERAKEGARELVSSMREGDALAIVLAGAPSRVELAATTDLGAARGSLDSLAASDRATDLDGAVGMARALVLQLPQVDKRIVVLSDLADGRPDAPPLGEGSSLPIWVALPELREPAQDCALLSADRLDERVSVKIQCSRGSTASGREVALLDEGKVVARGPAPSGEATEMTLLWKGDADGGAVSGARPKTNASPLVAHLMGKDAIDSDDWAPVVLEASKGSLAVFANAVEESAATGGAPIVEQALSALQLDVAVHPLPALPDRAEDLEPFAGILVDDPPGLTPEERRALGVFVEGGGVVLFALGPHAAAAPLGASFEPVLKHAPTWARSLSKGADPRTAVGPLVQSAASVTDLAAVNRAVLAADDSALFEPLLKWTDDALLIGRRTIGRGQAWVVTLPFAVDASDLPLRPLFLSLLDAWVSEARSRAVPRRTDVGTTWAFPNAGSVVGKGPGGPLSIAHDGPNALAVASVLGSYEIVVDGRKEVRVAAPVAREIDLRPRQVAPTTGGAGLGDSHASVDASPAVALVLLFLVATEMALRLRARLRDPTQAFTKVVGP